MSQPKSELIKKGAIARWQGWQIIIAIDFYPLNSAKFEKYFALSK
ncbi:MAG: hypothetical protein WBG70_21330 [Spirulinaceae cyanobacterium]